MRKGVAVKIWGILLFVMLLVVAAGGVLRFFSGTPRILALLPSPDVQMPYALFHAEKGQFSERIAGMILGDSTLSPEGENPLRPFIPILGGADESALMVWADDNHLRVFAAYEASKGELKSLSAGEIPSTWGSVFADAAVQPAGQDDVWTLSAANLSSPLLFKVNKKIVCLAATSEDINAFIAVASDQKEGFRRKWTVEPSWENHMLISEGGLLSAKSESEEAPVVPLVFEVSMKTQPNVTRDDKEIGSEDKAPEILGEARWSVSGMKERLGSAFLAGLKPLDWSAQDVYVPNPALVAMGVSVPVLPSKRSLWPVPLQLLAEQGDKMGLKNQEVKDLLAGPLVASIAGKTRILWLSLPGLVLDMSGRGELGFRLVEAFWKTVFMGAIPTPMDGFIQGGVTDLPFSLVAAARSDKVLIGLMDPENDQDRQVAKLVAQKTESIGWAFLDLPRLGESLNDMTQVKSLLSEDDEDASVPLDNENANDPVKNVLNGFAKLFISWEKPESGSAVWFQ